MSTRLTRPEATAASRRSGLLGAFRSAAILLLTITLAGVIAVVHSSFLSLSNVEFMLVDSVVLGLVALGETVVLLGRGIDLSVAPVMGLGAAVTGILATTGGLPLSGAIVLSLGLGAVLGAINGILVAVVRVPSIIATLGTLFIYQGLIFVYLGGRTVNAVPLSYSRFGNKEVLPHVPLPVLLLVVVTAACWLLMRQTRFGRDVYAIGGDAEVARNLGVAATRTAFLTFVLSGVLAAFAGLVQVSYTGYVSSETGTGTNIELTAIAAAVIGGTSVAGGRGNVVGSVIATLFLTVVLTAVVYLHVPATWQAAAQGMLILAAVSIDAFAGRRAEMQELAP